MRVALCCKEPLFGQALASVLTHEGHFDVVALATNARSCISIAKDQRAEAIVAETLGLEKNELEFLMGARAYGDFAVVLIATDGDQFAESGADAVLVRSAGTAPLIKAIADVSQAFVRTRAGRVREHRRRQTSKFELSLREFEVASQVAKGFSNRRISEVVGLKEQSVKNLVSVIMRKLNCENRVQVALRLSSAKVEDSE